MEAVNLISSASPGEKQVGYMACTLLLNEGHDFLRLVINSISKDLVSSNDDVKCLALTCIANVGGKEFAESLGAEVVKILTATYGNMTLFVSEFAFFHGPFTVHQRHS